MRQMASTDTDICEPARLSWPVQFAGFLESINEQHYSFCGNYSSYGVNAIGNNNHDSASGSRSELLAFLNESKLNGKFAIIEHGDANNENQRQWSDRLELDCTELRLIGCSCKDDIDNKDNNGEREELLVVVPLHQIVSVGFVQDQLSPFYFNNLYKPHQLSVPSTNHSPVLSLSSSDNNNINNILAVRVGDVMQNAPGLFDIIILIVPSELYAHQICQHFVKCFQFLYQEAIASMEQQQGKQGQRKCDGCNDERDEQQQYDLAKMFAPVLTSSASEAASFSSSISALYQQHSPSPHNLPSLFFGNKQLEKPFVTSQNIAVTTTINLNNMITIKKTTVIDAAVSRTSGSTSSTVSTHAVELINEYLTMLSACLSHEELNKFAILIRRWRAREMPILEFAQKLLELYGPERRHLLARMRTLLRGDPIELEALSDFLHANGIVEDASAALAPTSSPLTADMSLSDLAGTISTSSCPPSTASSLNTQPSTSSASAHVSPVLHENLTANLIEKRFKRRTNNH